MITDETSSAPLAHPECDDAALAAAYREHFRFVWFSLRRLGVTADDLEDAAHDVFLVFHRRAHLRRGTSTLRTWLFGVARRVAANYRRTHQRAQRRKRAWAHAHEGAPGEPPKVEACEAHDLLDRFLERLSEPQRCAFVLCELHELTAKEASAALGVNPNTLSARLRSARKSFSAFASEVQHDPRPWLVSARTGAPPPAPAERRVWALLGASIARTGAPWAKPLLFAKVLSTASLVGVLVGGSLAMGEGPTWPTATRDDVVGASADTRRSSAPSPPDTAGDATSPSLGTDAEDTAPPNHSNAHGSTAIVDAPIPGMTSDVSAPRGGGARTGAASVETRSASTSPSFDTTAAREPRSHADEPTSLAREPSTTLADERRVLAEAQRLARDGLWPEVLHRVQQYHRRFPHGIFAAEITLLELRARCRVGEGDEARMRAEAWAAKHPGTPQAAIARTICPG